MRKLLIALFSGAMLTATASAEDVKIGIILGFTGPIESLTPDMAAGAELAIAEVNGGGKFMGGSKVTLCILLNTVCSHHTLYAPRTFNISAYSTACNTYTGSTHGCAIHD